MQLYIRNYIQFLFFTTMRFLCINLFHYHKSITVTFFYQNVMFSSYCGVKLKTLYVYIHIYICIYK